MPTSTGTDPVADITLAGSTEPALLDPRPVSSPSRRWPTWAIALVAVLGAGLLLLLAGLALSLSGDSTSEATASTASASSATLAPGIQAPATQPEQTVAAATTVPPAAQASTVSYVNEPLRLRGIGAIEFGMSVEEAERIVGTRIVPLGDATGDTGCVHAQLENDTAGPLLMVHFEIGEYNTGRIVRAELPAGMTTRSGIGIGSTKAEVLAAYGDRIEVTAHKYTFAEGGEYLTFVPADGADANYRLIMETLNDQVTAVRSGILPAVELVEGCS